MTDEEVVIRILERLRENAKDYRNHPLGQAVRDFFRSMYEKNGA